MGASGLKSGGNVKMLPIAQGDTTVRDFERAWADERGFKKDIEYAIVYDPKNPNIGVMYEGNYHGVSVRPEELDKSGWTVTHYHPGNRFGGTLSMQDVRFFTNSQLGEVRAVTRQGWSYSLKAGPNADRKGFNAWAKRADNVLKKNFARSYDAAAKRAAEGRTVMKRSPSGKIYYTYKRDANGNIVKMNSDQAATYARQVSVGLYDRTLQKNAEKYGFTYTKTKSKK